MRAQAFQDVPVRFNRGNNKTDEIRAGRPVMSGEIVIDEGKATAYYMVGGVNQLGCDWWKVYRDSDRTRYMKRGRPLLRFHGRNARQRAETGLRRHLKDRHGLRPEIAERKVTK